MADAGIAIQILVLSFIVLVGNWATLTKLDRIIRLLEAEPFEETPNADE